MFLSKLASRGGMAIGVACTIHCVFEYVCDFVICQGESMQPTLYSNNILICNKAIKNYDCFKRNDIVIAIHPFNPTSFICKRLIAMPGDIVLMNSTSVDDTQNSTSETIFIKPGSMWLEGDNRLNSTDSRNYGQIPIGLLKSKVMARVWPPSEFKIF